MGHKYWTKEQKEGARLRALGNTNKLGIKVSDITKQKIRVAFCARIKDKTKHPRWIKDRTQLSRISNQGERRTSAYFFWRKSVYKRDNWKCKINNNDCKGRLEAHHILGFTDYPKLRYDINNGITLCHFHHPKRRQDESNLSPYFKELVMNVK
jgi:hypothetical protein